MKNYLNGVSYEWHTMTFLRYGQLLLECYFTAYSALSKIWTIAYWSVMLIEVLYTALSKIWTIAYWSIMLIGVSYTDLSKIWTIAYWSVIVLPLLPFLRYGQLL